MGVGGFGCNGTPGMTGMGCTVGKMMEVAEAVILEVEVEVAELDFRHRGKVRVEDVVQRVELVVVLEHLWQVKMVVLVVPGAPGYVTLTPTQ